MLKGENDWDFDAACSSAADPARKRTRNQTKPALENGIIIR
jgi:hypothetical protein